MTALHRSAGGAVTRIDARAANKWRQRPTYKLLDALSPCHVAFCKQYRRLSINPWRGRVAVLLEKGCPARRRKEEAQRIRAQLVWARVVSACIRRLRGTWISPRIPHAPAQAR